ncbi:hypothetical protein WA1_32280 [Scytonema hofmannii PCC 7110]|uniref:Flagellar assembly protein H n=1 Tax=Scytonema hofmannii PCC 7110 TaxID=128403 RepID=A0A139X406_9CYAN|nr:hypothetical protein [Scytonema hofmannii]KYC39406.1 hypothetical protein WA1_32280 [Scytonema hofmannii PCC 7110]
MTRFLHDQFAKDYLEKLLQPYGEVKSSKKVSSEIREIDLLFAPTPTTAQLETLGLLGRIAAIPAILEPFRNAAPVEDICDCLLKLLQIRGELRREAKRNNTSTRQNSALPKLWILTPTASRKLLLGFGATQAEDWTSGVYFTPDTYRMAIIAIHQLPPTPETLWLRMLGRGRVQSRAIDELEALPITHPFRQATLELLYTLRQNLASQTISEPEDRELIMRLAPLYQQERELAKQEGQIEGRLEGRLEGQIEGRLEGRLEGQIEERRQVVENLLRVRFGSLDAELSTMIESILTLSPEEFMPLLLQLSRPELIARFGNNQ